MGISNKSLAQGEKKLLTLRTHPKALLGPTLLLLLILAAAITAAVFAPGGDNRKWWWLAIAVVAIALAIPAFVVPFVKWRASTYTITNRRLVTRAGVFTRTGRDIPLYRINDISFDKDLVDRMLGCGTLVVHDASEQAGVVMKDVPRVEQVQVMLQELLHQTDDGTDEGDEVANDPRYRR